MTHFHPCMPLFNTLFPPLHMLEAISSHRKLFYDHFSLLNFLSKLTRNLFSNICVSGALQ